MQAMILRCFVFWLCIIALGIFIPVSAQPKLSADELLASLGVTLKTSPEKSVELFSQIEQLESTLTQKQREHFVLLKSSSLGLRGKHFERVELVKPFIEQVSNPDSRVNFLYELSSAYSSLGDYENALKTNNESILLLPKIKTLNAKISALQASITLLNSLHAYDEAMVFADRIYSLADGDGNLFAKCYGLANRIEINFLRDARGSTQTMVAEATTICDSDNRKIVTLFIKAISAINLIDAGYFDKGIAAGSSLLLEFSKENKTSDYVTKLEESIARGYFKKGNLALAEQYGIRAYERASLENAVQLKEKTSETMAKIKRALGQPDSAMDYFEINLALKKKVLDDQLQKNLAYQRVKFDTQDKANQLALAEQKNKTLQAEKIVQQGKNQNLLLLITLSLILVTILGAWLIRTLRQKNIFQVSSQIDGLTQISNRSYFIDSAKQLFILPERKLSLILFDMDYFKSVNDTFGHSTGDWVLKTICTAVKSQLRPIDLFGRLGGEEFAICLTNLTEAGVLALAERCRAEIAAIDTLPSGSQFLISASFGIATRGVRGNTSFEDILAAADKALYFSKNGGRNMVSVFQ